MLPTVRQKLIGLVAVVVGGAAWFWASPPLFAADGSGGIRLLSGGLWAPAGTGARRAGGPVAGGGGAPGPARPPMQSDRCAVQPRAGRHRGVRLGLVRLRRTGSD